MSLSIVMYHYVRDVAGTRFAKLKVRTVAQFKAQLDHFAKHHTVVTAEEVIAASRGEHELANNAAWLTFDDGDIGCYRHVFPLLHDRNWQGSFFVPAEAIMNRAVLDVNKIQLILATIDDPARIIDAIRHRVGDSHFACLWRDEAIASAYDPPEIMFVKNALQRALPSAARKELIADLFAQFVSRDEQSVASELYLSLDQIRTMLGAGMYFGSHGSAHVWIGSLPEDDQKADLDKSLAFLSQIGAPTTNWIISYPSGSYNDFTLAALRERQCAVGLTVEQRAAEAGKDPWLELPRLDTNDFPI